MQILIAHPSSIATDRLRRQLTQDPAVARCHRVSTLTETYDFAEHQAPACVFLASSLADCPEFELLHSLLRIMGIMCVLIGQSAHSAPERTAGITDQSLLCLPENPSAADIAQVLRRIGRTPAKKSAEPRALPEKTTFDPKRIILIGASTGGIDALLKITRHFGKNCPPTLIVQHTGGSFAQSLIRLLDGATAADVIEARENAPLEPGHIYLAPGDQNHLCLSINQNPRLALRPGDLRTGHRPSVDVLFSSAIPYAQHVSAALLTGMGRDGASGLVQLRQSGAYTIGQDAATSVVYGMPRIAFELGGVCEQLPIEQIGPALLRASMAKARV